jgi:hypothetical protein
MGAGRSGGSAADAAAPAPILEFRVYVIFFRV